MKTKLPTKKEWEAVGFKVPDELCSKQPTPTTPARQAAERIIEKGWLGQRDDVITDIASIITAAYATERQQVREAIKLALKVIDGLEGQQAMPDNSHDADVAQLRDVLEKLS